MKFALWIIGLFALAVLIGLSSTLNVGYAILYVPPYRIELSINSLIIGIVALFAVVYIIIRLLTNASGLPAEVRRYQRKRKLHNARAALCRAGIAYFEGRLQRAEREANKALSDANDANSNALALLFAASASGTMRDMEKHSQYLSKLDGMPKEAQLARHILEAEQQLEVRQPLESLAAIERARQIAPNLTRALRLELRIRLLQKQPDEVLRLTEKLLKADAIDAEEARLYRLTAYRQQLTTLTRADEVQNWFKHIPEIERSNPELLNDASRRLITLDDVDAASQMLEKALSRDDTATPAMAHKLGQIAVLLSPERRLAVMRSAEQWLISRSRDAELLLALGRLALAQQLWGKAQGYLEASLSIDPSLLLAHAELARLYDATGKPELAEQARNASLNLALKQVS